MSQTGAHIYVCRYCGPTFLHYVGRIFLYTCARCVKERQELVKEGAEFD